MDVGHTRFAARPEPSSVGDGKIYRFRSTIYFATRWGGGYPQFHAGELCQLAGEDFVRAFGEEFQAGGVAASDFEDTVAIVADFIEGFHHGGPVVFSLH